MTSFEKTALCRRGFFLTQRRKDAKRRRVLVNADTRESLRLVNDRMAYVAISRARYDAVIYTESAPNLGVSLDRSTNKESALEATQLGEWLREHVVLNPGRELLHFRSIQMESDLSGYLIP